MVGVDNRPQLLAGQGAVNRLAQDVPGAAAFLICNLIAITSKSKALIVEAAVKNAGGPNIFRLGNDPGPQGAAGTAGVEDCQLVSGLGVVNDAHLK